MPSFAHIGWPAPCLTDMYCKMNLMLAVSRLNKAKGRVGCELG